ncbi:hypothetical protein AVEN_60508-1 [Araneus ventricosus]|uniref:Uncharacterized protein n=1 Tax=Araneus ventricosus TaxID=182803 RepID=A0A4Y2GAF9_ARAVE|nr:hypothetical protein AVEN_60506-1 [Araneus ventricosus]GBM49778.1 hypothetical protein AVEN_60508-1 [Araneus ventricosus]
MVWLRVPAEMPSSSTRAAKLLIPSFSTHLRCEVGILIYQFRKVGHPGRFKYSSDLAILCDFTLYLSESTHPIYNTAIYSKIAKKICICFQDEIFLGESTVTRRELNVFKWNNVQMEIVTRCSCRRFLKIP